MSPKLRAKIDGNQTAVVAALKARGWLVLSLAGVGKGCPDLLCYRPKYVATGHELIQYPVRQWALVEVKAKRGTLTPWQVSFQAQGWPVTVVRTVAEAEAL